MTHRDFNSSRVLLTIVNSFNSNYEVRSLMDYEIQVIFRYFSRSRFLVGFLTPICLVVSLPTIFELSDSKKPRVLSSGQFFGQTEILPELTFLVLFWPTGGWQRIVHHIQFQRLKQNRYWRRSFQRTPEDDVRDVFLAPTFVGLNLSVAFEYSYSKIPLVVNFVRLMSGYAFFINAKRMF